MSDASNQVDATKLPAALETAIAMLREKQRRTAEIQARAEGIRKELDACEREHEIVVKEQAALSHTISIFEDFARLVVTGKPEIDLPAGTVEAEQRGLARSKPVARIGKQHYRLLNVLRIFGPLSLSSLAETSMTTPRATKLQMTEDTQRGLVHLSGEGYDLTEDGRDLLQRFEDYRRSAGQPLPLAGPTVSDPALNNGESDDKADTHDKENRTL